MTTTTELATTTSLSISFLIFFLSTSFFPIPPSKTDYSYEGTEYINMPHGKGVFYSGVQGGGLGINNVSFF